MIRQLPLSSVQGHVILKLPYPGMPSPVTIIGPMSSQDTPHLVHMASVFVSGARLVVVGGAGAVKGEEAN